MPKLFNTTKAGKPKHKHIAYLRDDVSGVTSLNKGHYHDIEDLLVVPEQEDGHTHDLIEYEIQTPVKQEKDTEIVNDVLSLYKEASEIESESRKKGIKSKEFYKGDQWDPELKRKLSNKNRAAQTLNQIEAKIDLLSGFQRQNRTDIKFLPVEEGDAGVADILNVVVKNITEQNKFEHEETMVFEDEVIVGRGLFNIFESFEDDLRGKIKIERFNWADVHFGPHEKRDLEDCEYLIKTKWFSKARLEQMFPEKAKELQSELDLHINNDETDDPHSTNRNLYEGSGNRIVQSALDADLINIARKEFRVLELWRKEYSKSYVLFNIDDDFYMNGDGWRKEDVDSVKTLPGFKVISRVSFVMRVTKIASKTLLTDERPDLAMQDFHIVPVYAKKSDNDYWGKVEGVKDAQMEVNKRHSQAVDILNKTASYGYFVDDQTFGNQKDKDDFQQNSSSPGFVQNVVDTNRPPKQAEGIKFPNEIVALLELGSSKIREIMNINLELEGKQSNATSGIAILERKKQGLIGNEFLFDNLSFAKKKLGKLIVAYIQKLYTPERILRLIENQNDREPVEIAGQPLFDAEQQDLETRRADIINLLENSDLTKYDVVVAESANTPTTRTSNFLIWLDAAGKGMPIPPSLLVDLSDLPDKEKVKAAIQEQEAQLRAQEDKKFDTEIQKTIIAKSDQPVAGAGGPV